MKKLLYKEYKLAISPMFFLVPLLGVLILIPQWPYFVALMYCFFITIPNIFMTGKAQNDIGFSVMLPVRKRDVVKSKILAVIGIELLHILVAAVFAAINTALYKEGNFLMDANVAFFGFSFVMFAVFNIIFFPMFYKTADKVGLPTVIALTAAIIFAAAVEIYVQITPAAAAVLDGTQHTLLQLPVLLGGIVVFVLLDALAIRMSANRFEKIDL